MALQVAWLLTQIAAGAAVLAVSGNAPCDVPLQLFVIVYMVRLGLTLPVTVYERLYALERHRAELANPELRHPVPVAPLPCSPSELTVKRYGVAQTFMLQTSLVADKSW